MYPIDKHCVTGSGVGCGLFLSGCVFMMNIQIHTDVFQENSHEYIYAHMYAGVFFQNITVSSVSVFPSSPSWP